MIGVISLLVVLSVVVYKVFRCVEIRLFHRRFKHLGLGVYFSDESCTYYKEYKITIALIFVFITLTFTR